MMNYYVYLALARGRSDALLGEAEAARHGRRGGTGRGPALPAPADQRAAGSSRRLRPAWLPGLDRVDRGPAGPASPCGGAARRAARRVGGGDPAGPQRRRAAARRRLRPAQPRIAAAAVPAPRRTSCPRRSCATSPTSTTTTTRRSARWTAPTGAASASPATSATRATRSPPRSRSPSSTTGRAAGWAPSCWPGCPAAPARGHPPLHRAGLGRQRGHGRAAPQRRRQPRPPRVRHRGVRDHADAHARSPAMECSSRTPAEAPMHPQLARYRAAMLACAHGKLL